MSETFTLDTSGEIFIPDPRFPDASTRIRWTDLDPFTQGYIEALFASEGMRLRHLGEAWKHKLAAGFSDLAPETLALIIADCAEVSRHRPATTPADAESMKAWGRHVWKIRQAGCLVPHDPPLAPYLGDDGKVYLREPGQ